MIGIILVVTLSIICSILWHRDLKKNDFVNQVQKNKLNWFVGKRRVK